MLSRARVICLLFALLLHPVNYGQRTYLVFYLNKEMLKLPIASLQLIRLNPRCLWLGLSAVVN